MARVRRSPGIIRHVSPLSPPSHPACYLPSHISSPAQETGVQCINNIGGSLQDNCRVVNPGPQHLCSFPVNIVMVCRVLPGAYRRRGEGRGRRHYSRIALSRDTAFIIWRRVVTVQVILEQVIHSDSANNGTSDKSGDPASMILYTKHTWKMCQTRKNRCSAPPAAQFLLMRCHAVAVAA